MLQEFFRSTGRAGIGVGALVAATIVSPATAIPVAAAADCPDAEVVFARGTNEPVGMGRVGDAFVESLRQQSSGLNIRTYGVNYAASKLQLHGGDGANDVISHVKSTVSSCPTTKIVLGGYSQGASVMDIVAGVPIGGISWGSALPPEYASNIAAVVTFGDIADRSGGSLPTLSPLLGAKAVDYCNPIDPICHAGAGNEWTGHTEGYVPTYTTLGATFVANKLMAGTTPHLPSQLSGNNPLIPASPAPLVPGSPSTGPSPMPAPPDAAHGSVVGSPGTGVQVH